MSKVFMGWLSISTREGIWVVFSTDSVDTYSEVVVGNGSSSCF